MNPIRRLAAVLAALAGALLASAAAAPAALAASPPPLPPGWNKHPPMPREYVFRPVVKVPGHTVVVGGMPGWQITLIAIGAALLAATVAVLAYGVRAARQREPASAA